MCKWNKWCNNNLHNLHAGIKNETLLSVVLNSLMKVCIYNYFNLHFYNQLFFLTAQILVSISASQSALQTFCELLVTTLEGEKLKEKEQFRNHMNLSVFFFKILSRFPWILWLCDEISEKPSNPNSAQIRVLKYTCATVNEDAQIWDWEIIWIENSSDIYPFPKVWSWHRLYP